jgi:polysaccharide export outer membrane protein
VLPVCYDDIVQTGDTATNYQIFPGDRVFVPSPGFLEQLCHKMVCPPCNPPLSPCPLPPQPPGAGCADAAAKPQYTAPLPTLPAVKPVE